MKKFNSNPSDDHKTHRLPGRLRLLAVVAILCFLMVPTGVCFGVSSLLSPENRRDFELQPGVVLLVVSFKATFGPFSCEPASLGTGFLYRPDGYLITNGHVAKMANEDKDSAKTQRAKLAIGCLADKIIADTLAKQSAKVAVTNEMQQSVREQLAKEYSYGHIHTGNFAIHVYLDNEKDYPGEIKVYSNPLDEGGKDIAIIKIDGNNLPTAALGNSDEASVGDPITVIGYPGAATNATLSGLFSRQSVLVPTVTNGHISAVNKADYKGTPVLQSEAAVNPGNSGGPAFDAKGRVIGIATFNLTESSNLNFFVPINTALEFVRQAGAPPQRGRFDQIWHDALDAYASQHWSKAHELMGNVLEMMPGQPDAKKLQLQAAQNIPGNPIVRVIDALGLPMFIGIVVVLLAVLAGLFVMMVNRKSVKPKGGAIRVQQAAAAAVAGSSPEKLPALTKAESYGSLHVTSGPLAGNRFPIPKQGLLIGRDPSRCAVVLTSDTASKEHAWVVPLDSGVVVIDRNSSNGTYVNSTDSPRISKVTLKNGDRIFIGSKNATEITYFNSNS